MQSASSIQNQQLILSYEEMGYPRLLIEQAFQLSRKNKKEVIDILVQLTTEQQEKEDRQQQIRQSRNSESQIDPKVRRDNTPTVLKSTQHVKFFNAFLQVYFHIPKFVEHVFHCDYSQDEDQAQLMKQLQTLFCLMIFSKKKEVDPSQIFTNIVDDMGNRVPTDRDTDIEEFIFYFLSQVEQALRHPNLATKQLKPANEDISDDLVQQANTSDELYIEFSSGKKKKSSLSNESEIFLHSLFIGQYVELSKSDQTKSMKLEKYLHIIPLSREFSDLYEAWQYKFHLDELPNETETWMKRAPKLLVFSVQACNQTNNFKFESHIYVDRFLFLNKEQFLKNRKKLHRLKEKRAELEELLKNYENYYQSNVSIPSLLEMTIKILQQHSQELQQENPSIDIIVETIIDTNQEISKLRAEISQTSEAIDDLFTNMKEYKYDLHSIIMSHGSLDTGNECVFIRDRTNTSQWMKFEETSVETKTFDQLLIEATENQNMMYLTYIESQFDAESEYVPLYSYIDPSAQPNKKQDTNLLGLGKTIIKPYQVLINDNLRKLAADHNKQFEQELQNQIYQKQAEQAINNYCQRINHVQNFVNSYNNSQSQIPALHNFAIFLRSQTNDAMSDDLFKWQVLDCAIRDVTDLKLTLQDIKNIPSFAQKSSHLFLNMNPYKAPTTINVSQQDMQRINLKSSEYVTNLQQARGLIYAMESILGQYHKWHQGMNAMKFTLELNLGNYFHNLALELIKITLIRLCNEIYNLHSQQKYLEIWENCQLIMSFSQYLLLGEVVLDQIIKMMQEFAKKCNKKALNSDQQKIIKSFMKTIQEKSTKEVKGLNLPTKQDAVLDAIIYDQTITCDSYYWQIDVHNEVSSDLKNQISLMSSYFQSEVKFKKEILRIKTVIEYDDRVKRNYHRGL